MPELLLPDEGLDERRKDEGAAALILPPLADPVASANAREATTTDPEKFAKAKAIAEQLALPVPVVERNFESLDSELKVRDMQTRMVADPFYADRMRDPDFAKLSQDDDLSLTGVAKAIALLPWKATQSVASGLPKLIGGFYGAAAVPFELASQYVGQPLLGRLLPADPFAQVGAALRGVSAYQEEFAKRVAAVPKDAGLIHRAVASGFQSLGANLPPLIAALYTGNLPTALYLMSGSVGGQSFTKGREAGLSPIAATQFGFNDAAIEYLTEIIPLTKLLGGMKAGSSFIKSLMQNQVQEQLGEQAATVLQDFNEWVTLKPDAPFAEYLAERPSAALQTSIATVIGSGGQVAILHAVQSDAMRQEAKANAEADAMKELLVNAGNSLLRERSPETFTQFVAAATENAPVDAVYVNAAVFMQEVEKAGLDLAKMPETQAALQDALATTSDVRIPLSEFASAVPGTTMEQSIIPHLKTDPDGATQQETKDKAWVEDTMKKTQRILDAHDFTSQWKESAATVKQELLTQLTQANRFTRDVNDAYASFMSAFYSTQAHRLGITPEQMYVKYPLQIRAQSVAGDNVLSQRYKPFSARPRQPEAVSLKAVHFSHQAGLRVLEGGRSGTGIRGEETARLKQSDDPRIKRRVYFYEDKGDKTVVERGLGPNAYRVELQNLYPFESDPRGILPRLTNLHTDAARNNAMESMVVDEGFDGYAADGMAVVFDADVPVGGDQNAEVNIGLKVGETGSITSGEALAALRATGATVTRSEVKQSGTEPTLVAQLSRALTDAEAHAVAVATKQEAIVQQAQGAGKLHGPNAAAWGPFNPEFFLTLDDTYNQDSVPSNWYYSELAAQIDKLEVPAEGWTPAQWKAKLIEPEYVKQVGLRDEKNKPITDLAGPVTKNVTVQARALLPGTKIMEIEATGIMEFFGLRDDLKKAREGFWSVVKADGSPTMAGLFTSEQKANDYLGSVQRGAGWHVVQTEATISDKVTKLDVQTFLSGHGVQVEETILSSEGEAEEQLEVVYDEGSWETEDPDEDWLRERAEENDDYKEALEEAQKEKGGQFLSAKEKEAILDRFIEKEREYYYDDPESPQNMTVEISQGNESVIYAVTQSYGDTEIYTDGDPIALVRERRRDGRLGAVDIEASIRQHAMEYREIYDRDDSDREAEGNTQYHDYQLPGGEEYFELLLTLRGKTIFNPPHFSNEGANLLAHMRANTRFAGTSSTDPNAREKILFIEEIQSDWAQKGRDEGFVGKWYVTHTKNNERVVDAVFNSEEEANAAVPALREKTGASAEYYSYGEGTISPAPLITKTDAWVALVWKRMIRYAAENNYDRIAWTRGDQQVSRWSGALRKRVDYIEWVKTDQGVQLLGFKSDYGASRMSISGNSDDGFGVYAGDRVMARFATHEEAHAFIQHNEPLRASRKVVDTTYKEDALSDAIGKAMGRQILGDPARTGIIEGDEITIDDIGMAQFYGDAAGLKGDGNAAILAKVANDVLKKFGGGKVEASDAATENAFDYTGPELSLEQVHALTPVLDQGAGFVAEGVTRRMTGPSVMGQVVADAETFSEALQAVAATRGSGAADAIRFAEAAGGKLTRKPTQPGFAIPADLKAKALSGFPLFQQQRGQITFATDIQKTPSVITLLQNANLSTFLHESGHFFLEVLNDMASQPEAPQFVVDDLNTTLAWFGITAEAWRAMPMEQRRPYHEQLARGIEAYLFEGKSPSLELAGVFARFRAWMINVYQQLLGIEKTSEQFQAGLAKAAGGELRLLTPEVRQVMSRLLATNDEIMRAEDARSFVPLFETKPPGMSDADWVEYQKLPGDATQNAIDQLQTRSLRDMQYASRAKADVLKRLQRQASDKRSGVRAEVQSEVTSEPIYQVMHFLRTGKMTTPEGEEIQVTTFRLDTNALREMYPPDALANLDLSRLNGMTRNGGIHPDLIAQMFGYGSGDELVRKLVDAEPLRQKVDGLTDQRMLERYGDLADPDNMEKAANAAVHNDVRGRFVATELRTLDKAVGQRSVLIAAAKDYAATLIARKKVRDIRPHVYAAAETKAGKGAERAVLAGDTVLAAAEKRNQLVNLYAAKSAYAALDEVDKGVARMKRIGESSTLDPAYREQVAALLERFDLRKVTGKEAKRRTSLVQWIEKQREQNMEPVIDPLLENEALRKPYQDLTLEEFRGLVDSLRNIEHLGRLKHKLLIAADQRAFNVVVAEAAASITGNAKRTVPVRLEQNSWTAKARKGTVEFFAMHRKFASFLREMDGYSDTGVLQRLLVHTSNAAGAAEAVAHEQATIKLSALFKALPGRMSAKTLIPAINTSLSREGRIMVALNMGNEGNLQRLLDGDHWTTAQAQAVLDTLTKAEMDFVQGVWNFVGEYRTLIGEQQKRLTGLEPEWVEPRQVVTAHGVYAGGYIPAKYDTARSTRSLSDEAAAGLIDAWRAKRGAAQTRASFTKERADKVVDRPLRKDFGVITQHVTEVTHRLAWQEWLVDANRLLRASAIDGAIREHYGAETLESLRNALEDIAAGAVPGQNAFERSVNYIRMGATIAGLGWRLTTSLLQPLGLTQSIVRIGPKWVGKGLAEWLGDAAHMENTVKRIGEKSNFMRLRSKTMQREISEIRDTVAERNSVIEASFFYLIQKMQLVADVPTWLGQYAKAVDGGANDAEAVAQADQAVIDTQGSGQVKDLAAIQRGGPLLKLFTNFYSFFNTTFNMTSEAVGRARTPGQKALLAVDFLLLYTVPAVLGDLIRVVLSDDDDEDKIVRELIAGQLNYMLGTMVGLREVSGATRTLAGLPGDYGGPASLRLFGELAKLGKQAGQGEADEPFWKALNNVGGVLFHYPAGQINATADGIVALTDGRTSNPGALAVGSSKR